MASASDRTLNAAKDRDAPPDSIGLNPLRHEWLVDETEDDEALVFVRCALANGMEFAHVLFTADWAEVEHAEHVAKLHNHWLAERKKAGLV